MNESSFWQRLRFKFRVSILNENTLNEVGHFRLSRFGLISLIVMLFIISYALFALLIWFTPLKNYLPGLNANIRQELITEVNRVDSLEQKMLLQQQYLTVIKGVVTGEVQADTIQPLDSLALRQGEKLLEEANEFRANFMQQYEEKEKENLTLFAQAPISPVLTLFRPVRGTIEQSFSASDNRLYTAIRAPIDESINAVLAGTIISVDATLNNEFVITLSHEDGYISVYRNVKKSFRQIGDKVQAGENIGIVSDTRPLLLQIWQRGNAINPEEVISF